jgi:pilus assembly protein Flp/PilA
MTPNPRNGLVRDSLQFAGDSGLGGGDKCALGFASVHFFCVTGDLAMKKWCMKMWSRLAGATMVEYGLLVSVIAILVVGGATTLGTDLSTLYNSFATAVTNAL